MIRGDNMAKSDFDIEDDFSEEPVKNNNPNDSLNNNPNDLYNIDYGENADFNL